MSHATACMGTHAVVLSASDMYAARATYMQISHNDNLSPREHEFLWSHNRVHVSDKARPVHHNYISHQRFSVIDCQCEEMLACASEAESMNPSLCVWFLV